MERVKMSRQQRAKQFAPVNALKGLQNALRMKEYEHDRSQKADLSEEKILEISKTIQDIKKGDKIYLKYFVDGYYKEVTGTAKVDIPYQILEINDQKINFNDLYQLKIIK